MQSWMAVISLLRMAACESLKPNLWILQEVLATYRSGTWRRDWTKKSFPVLTTWKKNWCLYTCIFLPEHEKLWPSDSSSLPAWLQLQCHERHEGPGAGLCHTPAREVTSSANNTAAMKQHKEACSNRHFLPFWRRNGLPDDWEPLD